MLCLRLHDPPSLLFLHGSCRKGQVAVFHGMRVRMGMYTGISNPDDIVFNRAAGAHVLLVGCKARLLTCTDV